MTRTAEDYASTIRLRDLWEDPYPIYQRLRRHQPVAWVPAANRYLATRPFKQDNRRADLASVNTPANGLAESAEPVPASSEE